MGTVRPDVALVGSAVGPATASARVGQVAGDNVEALGLRADRTSPETPKMEKHRHDRFLSGH
jgi:hypothetical protein